MILFKSNIDMHFILQTWISFKQLPLFFKIISSFWILMPTFLFFDEIKSMHLLNLAYFIISYLVWFSITLAITFSHAFLRKNKITIKKYTEDNCFKKITSQTFVRALQSKRHLKKMKTRLPPNLQNDLALNVGAKWGQIGLMLINFLFFCFIALFMIAPDAIS